MHVLAIGALTPLLPNGTRPEPPPTEVVVVVEAPPEPDDAQPSAVSPRVDARSPVRPPPPTQRARAVTTPIDTAPPRPVPTPPELPAPPEAPVVPPEPAVVPPAPVAVVPPPSPAPPPPSVAMPAVAQDTANDQPSPDARFLSDRTNATDRETQASVTSLDNPGPTQTAGGDSARAMADGGDASRTVADRRTQGDPQADPSHTTGATRAESGAAGAPAVAARPEVRERPAIDPTPVTERVEGEGDPVEADEPSGALTLAQAFERARAGNAGSVARPAIAGVAEHTFGSMQAVFGDRDGRDAERVAAERRSGQIGGDAQERWDRTRAALENFDALVERGEETSLNTIGNDEAAFIHAVHNAIHPQWTAFVAGVAMGSDTSVADSSLEAIADFAVAGDGEVTSVRIRSSSGNIRFDAEIIDLLYRISPLVAPPSELQSMDGTTYVRWHFHRDERLCTSAFADVFARRSGE